MANLVTSVTGIQEDSVVFLVPTYMLALELAFVSCVGRPRWVGVPLASQSSMLFYVLPSSFFRADWVNQRQLLFDRLRLL